MSLAVPLKTTVDMATLLFVYSSVNQSMNSEGNVHVKEQGKLRKGMLSYLPLNTTPLHCVLPYSLTKDAKYLLTIPQSSPTIGHVFFM